MFKKVIVSFILVFLLFAALVTPNAKAQGGGNWYNQSFEEWSAKVFDDSNPQEIFGERYTYAQVTWILHSLQAFAYGDDLINCVNVSNGDLNEIKDCVKGLQESSSFINSPVLAIGAFGDSVLSLHPASGVEYVADTASRLKIIPSAYAQGIGFEGLQPALKAWKVTRNMTYALSILAVIVMSFMIMFRVKISPQVVITVQSALPKIIIALILITFSYAIAGFIIDISYLLLGIIAALVTSSGVDISSLNMIPFFNTFVMGSGLFWSLILTQLLFLLLFGITGALVGALFAVPTGGLSIAIGGGIGAILFLLLIVLMIFASIKILWLLVKTTINILLLIIAAPIMILAGTFSSGIGFGPWLRQLVANVAVFPMVRIMLFLAHYFFWGMRMTQEVDLAGWTAVNPLGILPSGGEMAVLPGYLPFSVGTGLLGWILSFGVFFLTPKIGDIIKSMIEGKPFAYGTAIGEAVGPIGAAWGSTPARLGKEAVIRGGGTEIASRLRTKGKLATQIGDQLDNILNSKRGS
ncbi:hypothetical protein KKE18_03110 [Patescibacteria group bacterium]|nr:hypothetical protein [Patescibacteria group bacterium]MBU0922770.1 hypothetical protein [Patescibacteria group bacterium]MBU1844918.1 hypothetical protein [Patescibacteria group bacterium]